MKASRLVELIDAVHKAKKARHEASGPYAKKAPYVFAEIQRQHADRALSDAILEWPLIAGLLAAAERLGRARAVNRVEQEKHRTEKSAHSLHASCDTQHEQVEALKGLEALCDNLARLEP